MKDQIIYLCLLTLAVGSCRNANRNTEPVSTATITKSKSKPPSGFTDTLRVQSRSAVFFYPDTTQLEKIKKMTEPGVYESSMHEYYYQLRYAHNTLAKYWHVINILEARSVRYLLFIKSDQQTVCVDLDKENDAYGLFVFDPNKTPSRVDLTNAETEISFYFSKKQGY